MLRGTFRGWVHADPCVVWSTVLDSVENPQRYMVNVENCKVLERLGGGVVKELTVGCESAPGVFDFFAVDGGILREIRSTDSTAESLHVFRSFTFDSAVVREVTMQGVRYREKLLISGEDREIRRELLDHPVSEGKIFISVAPLSVQNPMAPVDLQFRPMLAPRASQAGGCRQWHEETLLAVMDELRRMKETAEERVLRS